MQIKLVVVDDKINLHLCPDVSSVGTSISFLRPIQSIFGVLWLFEFPPLLKGGLNVNLSEIYS